MIKWRFLTMAPIVITEVQRVFRGFLGRLDAGILKKLHEAAITVVSRQASPECITSIEGQPIRLRV
jgi:hypothetical protein